MAIARWGWSIGAAIALSAGPSAAIAAEPAPVPVPDAPTPPATGGWMQLLSGRMSRGGYEVKYIYNDRYAGFLYGARAVRYLLPGVYAGLMGYGPLPAIGVAAAPAFGTLGLLTGYEGKLPYRLSYDLNLHAGLTRDLTDCYESPLRNQVSLEPSVSLGVPVPFLTGTRLSLYAGWMVLPLSFADSGPTAGLRWETKSISQSVAD